MKNKLSVLLALLLVLCIAGGGWLGAAQYKTLRENRIAYDEIVSDAEEQKAAVRELSTRVEELTAQNKELAEKEEKAAGDAAALSAELEQALADAAQLSLRLEALSAENEEKSAELASLQSDSELLNAAISILNDEIAGKDSRIAAMEEELRIKNSRMEYLESSAAGAFESIRLAYLLLSEELGLDPVLGLTMQDTDEPATADEPAAAPAPADDCGIAYYTAASGGISSEISVCAGFQGSELVSIEIDVSGETVGIGTEIGGMLAERFLSAQSPEIDAVAGATITSNAAIIALRECFAQAGLRR